MKQASDLFVECLEREGVEYIFGLPGEESLALLESIRRSSIKFIVTRHEQAAAFMAATCGRLTGTAGVVLSTLGPGATNLVTGVAYAQLGGMPLVVVTGQKPIRKSKQGQFQIINVIQMMQPITKATRQIVSPDLIPSLVRDSFRKAEDERPGAVHLEFPEDIASERTDARALEKITALRAGPDHSAVKTAARMIEAARHPIILIAAAANRKKDRDELDGLVTRTGIPFFTTQMGKGVLDERCECCLGTAALMENDFLHRAVERSDLIISIGHDVTEKPPFRMGYGGRLVIHMNYYPAPIDDVYFPSFEVIGDIALSVKELTANIRVSPEWDFSYFRKVISEFRKHTLEKENDPSFPVKPERFVADLRRTMPDDGILALDNGMFKIWIARNYPAYEQNTVLLDNALASMGAGLPAAIAAKLINPGKKVVCVSGDGGFMMNSQELETAIRLKLDLTVIIVNDGGFGMIKWKQDSMRLPSFGLEFGNPDFVEYASSFGARGYRIGSAGEFPAILAGCIGSKGVSIIDLPIDYSDNVKVLTDELNARTSNL